MGINFSILHGVGKDPAFKSASNMRWPIEFRLNTAPGQAWRWASAILLSGLVGLGAGQILKNNVSGAVSVVDGESMEPTYSCGTCVYTAPISTPLQRGDIVLLDDAHREYALKRIVGLPGESIVLWRGHVFVNGTMLREPYLSKNSFTLADERSNTTSFQLSANEYFVLGDNRLHSMDSRFYGPVNRHRIKSRVPLPQETLRADFAPYRLPSPGQRMIQAL